MENNRFRCLCRLFSCFGCFSDENTTSPRAQPHPSENAPLTSTAEQPDPSENAPVASTAAPNAPLTSTAAQPDPSENGPVASTAAPNAAQPDPSENALLTSTTDDALTHPHHGPQPIVPPAASTSSEAGTSTDVLTELNHPQPILHPDLCSSSEAGTSRDVLTELNNEIPICLLDAIDCRQVRPQKPRERSYPDYAVGIEKPLEEVKELLEWESEKNAVAVILHGFGGIGKTTLADAVFARVYVEGCKYSMVRLFDDVTSTPSTADIVKLQTYILKDLNMERPEETPAEIRTPEEGQQEIGRILQKEKAFIYIDNVLQRYPFEQLLPRDMDKAKKLRLLITTRDTDVKRECRKLETKIYAMKGLPLTEAKSLLEKEMYTSYTDNMENRLSSAQLDEIVKMCGYIPKLLTVVAGFISCEEDKQKAYIRVMEERERNWKGEIGMDIAHYVFAYQNLDEGLKDPFLDICSFFKEWEWSKVANIVGDGELNSLEKRALVTKKTQTIWGNDVIQDVIQVWVHDVILAMGHQQAEGTRFTSANGIEEFLEKKEYEDIRKIKGIMLQTGKADLSPLYISASKLDLMCSSLRVFRVKHYAKVEGTCEKIFEKLVYVEAKVSDLPFDVSTSKELKYLDVWDDWEEVKELLEYDSNQGLTYSKCKYIEKLLGSISKLPYLIVLKLRNCKNLTQLPEDIGSLKFLQYLYLDNYGLEALPSSLMDLSSLKLLYICRCQSFKYLPRDLGKLISLTKLFLNGCKKLSSIPSSLEDLSSLRVLDLSGCQSLKDLPCDLGKLTSLTELFLIGCKELISIPSSVWDLSSLRLLDLSGWRSLKDLPCDLGKLTSLTKLCLNGCEELISIPSSLGDLSSLRILDLSGCRSLKDLPCDLGKLTSLTKLLLNGCNELISIPSYLWDFSSLRVLGLSEWRTLKDLPCDLGKLTSLTELFLNGCKELISIPTSLGDLSSLRLLDLSGCRSLKDLPCDLGKLTSLTKLFLNGCKELISIPSSLEDLSSLTLLDLSGCQSLKNLPDLGKLTSLIELRLEGCKELSSIPEGIYFKMGFATSPL